MIIKLAGSEEYLNGIFQYMPNTRTNWEKTRAYGVDRSIAEWSLGSTP